MSDILMQYILNGKLYDIVKAPIINKLSEYIFIFLLYGIGYAVSSILGKKQPDILSDIKAGKMVICNRSDNIFCRELLKETMVCIWDLLYGILGIPFVMLGVLWLENGLCDLVEINESLAMFIFMFSAFIILYMSINCKRVLWIIGIILYIIGVYIKSIRIKILVIELISIATCTFICFGVYKYIIYKNKNIDKCQRLIKILKYLSGVIIVHLYFLNRVISDKGYSMWIDIWIIITLIECGVVLIKKAVKPEISETNLYLKNNRKVEIKKLIACDNNTMMYVTIDDTRKLISADEVIYISQAYAIKNAKYKKRDSQVSCLFCYGKRKLFNKYIIDKNKWVKLYDNNEKTMYMVYYTKINEIRKEKSI